MFLLPVNNSGAFDESPAHWSLLVASVMILDEITSPVRIFHLDSNHYGGVAFNQRAVLAMASKLSKLLKRLRDNNISA